MGLKALSAVTALGGIIVLAGCSSAGKGLTLPSLYKTETGKKTAYDSYDKAMRLWPVSFTDDWVDTEYGKTHVVVAGPEGGKPLFLLPGLFADATMWYANAGELSRFYRVYALDMINYGGKSEPSGKPVVGIGDYRSWFATIMAHYGHEKVAVAGLSYGSWLALALAREQPAAIAAAVLIDPSETFIPMDGGIAWKGFWSFAVFPNRSKYASFFNWMGGGYSDPSMEIWFDHMLNVIEFGSARMDKLPQHRVYEREELSAVTMPVLVLSGGKPIVYKDPAKFAAAAAAALPRAEVVIVPNTGHGLNMEKPDSVNERMLAFLKESYK
jgi:pimeloyl-ACP methyl ester carboxylesterase